MTTHKPDDGSRSIAELKAADRHDPTFLRKRIVDLTSETAKLRSQIGARDEFYSQVQAALASATPFPRHTPPPSSGKKKLVVPVIKLSDWHIGEYINKSETEGFGEYNYVIAQERIFNIVTAFLKWVEAQRALYRIETCTILCEGDWISGDIHEELMATNEFPVPVQTAKAGLLLGEVIAMISAHFKMTNVYAVGADNHGRLRKKPQAKQKSSNNYSYLVYEIVDVYLKRHKGISIVRPDAAKILVPVNNFRILSEHGDTVRGWSGHPYYGFDRRVGKEAVKRMNTDLGFHYWCLLPGQSYWKSDGSTIPVESIYKDDLLLTIDGTEGAVKRVLNTPHYEGDSYSFKVQGLPDEIRVTPEHLMYRAPGRFPAGHTRSPYSFMRGKKRSRVITWTQAKDVKYGDWLFFPVPRDVADVPDIDSDTAYLIGLYASEGHVSKDGQQVVFGFNQHKEEHLADFVLATVKRRFGLTGTKTLDEKKHCWRVRFCSKPLAKTFQRWSSRLAWNKFLESDLMRLPTKKQLHIFKGWLHGDGHIVGEYMWQGTTTSGVLARQMFIIGCRLGVRPSIWKREAREGHRECWVVGVNKKLLDAWDQRPIPELLPRRVRSVTVSRYEGPVYNCNVEGQVSYVIGGILTHNSIGHFHVPGLMEAGRVMINGSLSGTSEFDHLNGRHADPAQVAFLVHPKYGWFNFTAFGGIK